MRLGGKRSAPSLSRRHLLAAGAVTSGLFAGGVWLASSSTVSSPVDDDRVVVDQWGAVAVLDTEGERNAGVRAHPLEPGEFLVFDFGEPTAPVWSMQDVSYPLRLFAVGDDGDVIGAGKLLRPCGDVCEPVASRREARFWIELRPTK